MHNPYRENDNQELLPSFVCISDILGFKDMISNSVSNHTENEALNKVRNALQKAYEQVNEFLKFQNFSYKVYTDNLLIGYPVPDFWLDNGERQFRRLFEIISQFQINLFLEGFFIRGGLSYGSHFMDECIVFGPALLEAYRTAEEHGAPPRICLSNSAIEVIKDQVRKHPIQKNFPYDNYLLLDIDGKFFLNYLYVVEEFVESKLDFNELLSTHKFYIEKNLNEHRADNNIRQKYEWVAKYHNFFCKEIMDKYLAPYEGYLDPENVNFGNMDQEEAMFISYIQDIQQYLIDVNGSYQFSKVVFSELFGQNSN